MDKPIVAAFDFDGTITTKDALVPFLEYVYGRGITWSKLLSLTPQFLGFCLGMVSRQDTKEAVLTKFFQHCPVDKILSDGLRFAQSKEMKHLLKPDMLEKIEWHRSQKHRLVLVSAGVPVHIVPWGTLHHFDHIICSRLAVDSEQRLTGKLTGKNCWGPEKVRRLEEVLGPRDKYILYAYGDSHGDKELLEYADHPVKVR